MIITLARRGALSIAVGVIASAAANGAELRGHIAGAGAKPIGHAVVLLLPEASGASKPGKPVRVETGDDGAFLAQGLTGANFRIRVEAKGYAPLTQPQIPAGASLQLRLQPGAKLKGVVRDRASGNALAGATVLAWEKDAEAFGEDTYRKAVSGKDGRFVVEDLPPGPLTVEARFAGHAPARTARIDLPKTELILALDPAGGLTGLVTDLLGTPVGGAEVKASWRDASGGKNRAVKTGADGRYRIPDAGTQPLERMNVRAVKFLLAERNGPAPADGVVNFVLERGGSIAGVVRGFDGKEPASFHVRVRGVPASSAESNSDHPFTDPSGAFQVDDLQPGTYTVEIGADRYASIVKKGLDVVADKIVDAGTLTLPSRASLRGRAVAARDRAPVAGATVHIALVEGTVPAATQGDKSWTETTDSDGAFATPELPGGSFDVLVEHPQFAPSNTRVPFQPDADNPELVVELFKGGSLAGTVVNGKLDPMPGVRIVATLGTDLNAHMADTGADGHYFIDGLAPGTYSVTRQQDRQGSGIALDTKMAAVREGETTTVDFDEKPRVFVSGTVLRGDAPIPDASISFISSDVSAGRDGGMARSDSGGAYQVGLRHGGRYQVAVVFGVNGAPNGHSVVSLDIPDQPAVHQDIVFNVLAISGRVIDAQRNGVKGAMVTALLDGAVPSAVPRQTTTMSSDDGSFRLEAIEPGTYRVTARARGFAGGEAYPVAVVENEPDPDLELKLERGWTMKGRLLDPNGRGVGGALVVVAPPGAAESGYLPTQTDASGAFRITAPPDVPVNVAAISTRFAPAVQAGIEMPADGDAAEVVLHAGTGGTLRVRVVHRNGDPAPGQRIAYQPVPLFPGSDVVQDRNPAKSTDPDGTTVVPLLYPGTYFVSLIGRRDVAATEVAVSDGTESATVIEVP
jgi:hypothetical protein